MQCSKCGCENNCEILLEKEVSLLETLLRVEEAKNKELRELLSKIRKQDEL